MSNANEPAYPTMDAADYLGLTKREAFAMAAMQGMLGNTMRTGLPSGYAVAAVAFADALLSELEKK